MQIVKKNDLPMSKTAEPLQTFKGKARKWFSSKGTSVRKDYEFFREFSTQ
jgi:hypothetical protein